MSRTKYLDETIALLIKLFGRDRLRLAITRALGESNRKTEVTTNVTSRKSTRKGRATVPSALVEIRIREPEKHDLLTSFLHELNQGHVLREPQDIKNFAQLFGLKEIKGRSRKELIPNLMHSLMTMQIEKLRENIPLASSISQDERRRGYSVLTDKLIRKD